MPGKNGNERDCIDEEEAQIVRMIYDWYLFGDEKKLPLSLNGIAVKMTRMQIPTRGDKQRHVAKKFGHGVWQRTMIYHIITNPTYTGVWHFGKTKMIEDGKHREAKPKCGMGKQVKRDESEWIGVPVPQIISPDLFERAQKRLAENRGKGGTVIHEYLLRGRLRCAKCGYALRGHTSRGRKYYVCNGRKQIVKLCDLASFDGDLLEQTIWEWIKRLLRDPQAIMDGLNAVQDEGRKANKLLYDRLDILDSQIKDIGGQLSRLLDLYITGDFSKELLIERKSRLEKTLADM